MQQSTVLLSLAVVLLALIPLVPKMIQLRVRVLHFVRLDGLANWHERNVRAITFGVRILLGLLAIVLGYLGVTGG